MHVNRIIVGLLLAASGWVVLGTSPAQAATVEECQALLTDLRQDTVDAGAAFRNPADLTRVTAKLDDAAAKLADGKNADAAAKVVGFQTSLTSLAGAPKPKLDADTAATLVTEAQGVVDCIATLEPPVAP